MRQRRLVATVIVCGVVLSACGEENRYVAPPPPKVAVANPLQRPVTRFLEATGNTAAVNSVNLVARVQGFVESINYQDGDYVKKDQLLFTVEPEPYRVKLEQSQAAEASAQASVKQVDADYERTVQLTSRDVASKQSLDAALANRDAARAKLQQAQGDTRQAAINYGYTQVKAPFDGIVTARQVSVGELVGGGGPTVLATIVETDPIWVNFNVSERDVLRIRAEMLRRGLTPQQLRQIPVEVGLQSETGYPHKGTLDYAAPQVTQTTGTLPARGVLPNADRVLLPGYFARVRVPLGEPQNALLVPEAALGSDQGGRYLLVVNKDNVVEQRKVELGPQLNDLRVIDKGLAADDRVVMSGLLKAIPGQKVDPQLQTANAQ